MGFVLYELQFLKSFLVGKIHIRICADLYINYVGYCYIYIIIVVVIIYATTIRTRRYRESNKDCNLCICACGIQSSKNINKKLKINNFRK